MRRFLYTGMLTSACTESIMEDSGARVDRSESRSRVRMGVPSPQSSDAVSEPELRRRKTK